MISSGKDSSASLDGVFLNPLAGGDRLAQSALDAAPGKGGLSALIPLFLLGFGKAAW